MKTPDEVKPPVDTDKVVSKAEERLKSRTFREADSEMKDHKVTEVRKEKSLNKAPSPPKRSPLKRASPTRVRSPVKRSTASPIKSKDIDCSSPPKTGGIHKKSQRIKEKLS